MRRGDLIFWLWITRAKSTTPQKCSLTKTGVGGNATRSLVSINARAWRVTWGNGGVWGAELRRDAGLLSVSAEDLTPYRGQIFSTTGRCLGGRRLCRG